MVTSSVSRYRSRRYDERGSGRSQNMTNAKSDVKQRKKISPSLPDADNIHRMFGRSFRCSRCCSVRHLAGHQATAAGPNVDRDLLQFSYPRNSSILFRPRAHHASQFALCLAVPNICSQSSVYCKECVSQSIGTGQSCELRCYHGLLPYAFAGLASEQSAPQFTRSSKVNNASSMTAAIKCQSSDGALI